MAFSSSFAPSGAFYHDPSSLTASLGSPRIGSVEVRALAFRSNLNPAPALASSPKEAAFLASFLARGDGGFAQKRKLSCFAGLDGGNGAGDDGGTGDRAGGGGGGDEGDGEDGSDEAEFGPVMKFEEVIRETEALEISTFSSLFGSAQIVIDSCCATFAEVQKRGKDFWAEFELYAADLLVGIVVDIALVGLLAPYVRIGRPSVSASTGFWGSLKRGFEALPSSSLFLFLTVFLKPKDQAANLLFSNGLGHTFTSISFGTDEYLVVSCFSEFLFFMSRSVRKSDEDIPVPPLVKSAVLWGMRINAKHDSLDKSLLYVEFATTSCCLIPDESACNSGVFLAVSSNTRYQIVNGLERVVEASPFAKRIPPIAMAFTVGVRFANNIYGGMQFVDWARWSGVQ
ncbi:hypothetical protein BHE74_00047935 [Ensete ventricosum]|nr:hypothetical protein BHE74_00047935 [Ensete ventricosum]